jgi:filamentous hemagglutinin
VQGAVGAGAASAAAPGIEQLQGQLKAALKDAGMNDSAANVIAGVAGGTTAAAVGAAASGGSTAGGATAFNADMNNRQLHPSEKQRIKDITKSTGLSEERLTRAACYAVKCWAEFPEGSQERAATYVSVAETFGLSKELDAIQSVGLTMGLFGYSATDQLKDSFKASALPAIKNSAKTVGGGLAIATGTTICSTSGVGCVVGAPLTVLGASEATEGATGLYRQYQGQGAVGFNPVRSGLNAASPVWGNTIYDGTYLGLSVLALGAPVPLKVGASDGINRANSMFGVTVPRWQNPIINPLTNSVLLSPTGTQGVLVYGVTTKVPAVVEDVNNARGGK